MTPETAAGHLQRARAGIRQALAEWNAADLKRVEGSCRLLSSAVSEMRQFETAARDGRIVPNDELRALVLDARNDIVQATRIVDACLAFHRGLATRSGDGPMGYDSEGHLTGEAGDLESEVHA